MPLIFFVALTAICNLMLLSAIAAGRSKDVWRQRLFVAAEVTLFVVGLVLAGVLGWASGLQDRLVALVFVLGIVFAMALAVLVTYLVYWLVGRRQLFGTDLRRSMWLSRGGMIRAGRDPQIKASAQEASAALASGDFSAAASALKEIAGEDLDPDMASVIKELESNDLKG